MTTDQLAAGLRSLLMANGTVSGLVSTRIYPERFPQKYTVPAIMYEIDDDAGEPLIGTGSGPRQPRVTVYYVAASDGAAKTLREAGRAVLDVLLRQAVTGGTILATRREPLAGVTHYEESSEVEALDVYQVWAS